METLHFNRDLKFDDLEHEALMGIWWSGVLLKKQAGKFFRKTPLTEAQFNIMLLLKYAETPQTQNDLCGKLLVDKSNITGLVNRLAAAGQLRRVPVPGDRRAYHLELTETGAQQLDRAEEAYREEISRIMRVFSPDEMHLMNNLTRRLQRSLEEREEIYG